MTNDITDVLAGRAGAKSAGSDLVVSFPTAAEADEALSAVLAIRQRPRPDVSTTAGLIAALKAAKPGQTVRLAPGVYRNVSLKGIKLAAVIVTGPGAILTDLLVHTCEGLTFEGLEFDVQADGAQNAFLVRNSKNIHFRSLTVHGTLNGDPQDDKAGIMFRDCERVSVTGSEFFELYNGVSHLNVRHMDVLGNRFHDLQKDGVVGQDGSFIRICSNSFTDFFPSPGDHPDAIQFWNRAGPATDIEISGNVVTRGVGGIVQGIFFRDTTGVCPFRRVKIADNTAIGTMYNGIFIEGGEDVEIAGNTVTGHPDMYSGIRVVKTSSLKLIDNQAQKFQVEGKLVKAPKDGNAVIPAAADGGVAILSARAANAPR